MNKANPILVACAATFLFLTSPSLSAVESPTSHQTLTKLNINQATAAQLANRLYGVGMAKAQAIVDYRTQHGKFTKIEQLTLIKGIGPAIVERNRALLQL